MDKAGRRPDCFLQVNIGDEPQRAAARWPILPFLVEAARVLSVAGADVLPPAMFERAPLFSPARQAGATSWLHRPQHGHVGRLRDAVMSAPPMCGSHPL